MFCPKCGEPMVDKANFCHVCGAKYEEKKEPEPEPEPNKEVDGVVVFTILILGIIAICFLYRYGLIH